MIFDLRNKHTCVKTLNTLYNLNEDLIRKYICSKDDYIRRSEFENHFKVSRKGLLMKDIMILLTHITTTVDDNEFLNKYGLVNLQFMFMHKSPLKLFLNKYSVDVNVEKKTVTVKDKEYDINRSSYKDYCGFETQESFLKEISRKIYSDHQITAFLAMESDTKYLGIVHKRPEILLNFSNLINYNLSQDWYNISKSQAVEFLVSPFDLEPCSYNLSNDDVDIYENFADHIIDWLIEKAINIAWHDFGYGYPSQNIVYVQANKVISMINIVNIREIKR